MTRIRDDIAYGYAVGRVRVLEGRLLPPATFERLLDAPDLREQRRVLAETHVGRYLEGAETAADVEGGLGTSLADLYDEFLERAGLPSAVVTYFQVPYDYANLRVAVKARVLGISAKGAFSRLGSIDPAAFVAEGASLPAVMRDVLEAWDGAEEPPDLEDVESVVDRAMFAALSAAARASKVRFLRELTVLRVDIANARQLVRSAARGGRFGGSAVLLIPGGSAEIERLASGGSRMTPGELAEAIGRTRALGAMAGSDIADAARFDPAADSVLGGRMRAARRAAGGAEPVLAYVLAREAEVLQLRTVIVGKLAGLDVESIRARLRERVA